MHVTQKASEKVMEAISRRTVSSMRSRVVFVCEKDRQKQKFLLSLDQVKDDEDTCVYDDVHDLSGEIAPCVRHGGECPVKYCDGFGSGFSCTSVSKYNPNSAEARGSLSKGGNATADTFLSSRAYMKVHRPKFTIMENVTDIDEGGSGESQLEANQSNLTQLRNLLSEIGYVTFVLLLNSKDFFIPQDRWRIYIGGVALEIYG